MSSDEQNQRERSEKQPFPHKEVAIGLSIAAVGFLLFSFASNIIRSRSASLDDEIAAKQAKLKALEEYYNNANNNNAGVSGADGQYIHPLDLSINVQHNGNTSGPSTPTLNVAVAADDYTSGPCTPPKGGFSSRQSIYSQPPSPKTHGVLEKLDSLNGEYLWHQLDPHGTDRVSKAAVLHLISNLTDLQNFLNTVATTITTPTLQGIDPAEYKASLLSRAVDKLAGANKDFVTKERWNKYLKGGKTFDPIHIDNVD